MRHFIITLICFTVLSFAAGTEDLKNFKGTVKEIQTGKPISNAMVFLHVLDQEFTTMTTTDENGNFIFERVPGKFGKITVNRMGYDGAEYGPLRMAKKLPKFKFELTPIPLSTEEVIISESHVPPTLVRNGFYERKEMRTGVFYDVTDFDRSNTNSFTQLVYRIPYLHINNQTGKIYTTRSSSLKGGQPHIYLDGIRIHQDIDLRDIIDINAVAGIEVYKGSATVPMRYSSFGSNNGVVLVWTK